MKSRYPLNTQMVQRLTKLCININGRHLPTMILNRDGVIIHLGAQIAFYTLGNGRTKVIVRSLFEQIQVMHHHSLLLAQSI